MRRWNVQNIALGGILAAVAMVIMCLGSLIPFATFACPMFCTLTGYIVFRCCGRRIAWTWFAVVCILSLFFAPDKEAAAVFITLGWYPFLKNKFDKTKCGWIMKGILFNSAVGLMYGLLIWLFGMSDLLQECMEIGMIGLVVLIILGNVVFFLLDRLLTILDIKCRKTAG